ncbi:MAG: M43 family zinc metalloprotease, partial [Bacteroidota bacterium]
ISEAQIQSQLDVLNEDFRRLNTNKDNLWPQAIDSEIEFSLATQDPWGDATCGITRTYTDSTKFYGKIGMKFNDSGGINGWPYTDNLNIWVCDLSGRLGFATFPGGSNTDLDGIVCDYQAFGRIGDLKPDFNLGRTATHEVGHWLNLRHIWGDGDCFDDDFVSDTPNSDEANYNCDVGHIS